MVVLDGMAHVMNLPYQFETKIWPQHLKGIVLFTKGLALQRRLCHSHVLTASRKTPEALKAEASGKDDVFRSALLYQSLGYRL